MNAVLRNFISFLSEVCAFIVSIILSVKQAWKRGKK